MREVAGRSRGKPPTARALESRLEGISRDQVMDDALKIGLVLFDSVGRS